MALWPAKDPALAIVRMYILPVSSPMETELKMLQLVNSTLSNNLNINDSFTLFTGRGVMPSVKLALDHVNEHSTILRNYRLHMWWNDTEVCLFA